VQSSSKCENMLKCDNVRKGTYTCESAVDWYAFWEILSPILTFERMTLNCRQCHVHLVVS